MAEPVIKVIFHKQFAKHFKIRIKSKSKLLNKFNQRYKLFIHDRDNPLLKDHALTGHLKGLRSFWIAGDIRVIYRLKKKSLVEFIDVGSHSQVYGS